SADGGSDLDRRRDQAVSVASNSRISRRGVSGAAPVAGRPIGKGLGARARINQCGRLAPADRAACTALSLGRAEGQRRANARLDSALAWRWFAVDRDAA